MEIDESSFRDLGTISRAALFRRYVTILELTEIEISIICNLTPFEETDMYEVANIAL